MNPEQKKTADVIISYLDYLKIQVQGLKDIPEDLEALANFNESEIIACLEGICDALKTKVGELRQ